MLQNVYDNFKIIRFLKGGYWIKTKYRGWITLECYRTYINYGYDPIPLKEEIY